MPKAKRKRDRKGHFVKKTRVKRKRPAARRVKRRKTAAAPKKRRRARKVAAPRKVRRRARRAGPKKIRRVKRALGRRPSGQFVKRRRHRVKGHVRKITRTRKRRIASHLSYETAAPNPRRRRRRARRAAREVMEETPMPRRRRRRAKKASAPRRRRRAAARENPVKRRRRRRVASENPRRRRRRSRKMLASKFCRTRSKSKRPRTRYVTVSRPRTRRRRKVTHRRRKASHRRTPKSHRLPPHMVSGGPEYIGAEYAMENPLSGGELLLAGATASLGYVITDMLDRWLAYKELGPNGTGLSSGNTTGIVSANIALTKPGIWRVLAQAGAAAVPFAAAYYVHQPMGRAALQGAGIGALVHLGQQLLTHFVIAKWVGGSAPAAGSMAASVSGWYAGELQADNASDFATTGTNGTLVNAQGSVAGTPRGLAAPRAYQVPRALGGGPIATAGVAGCGPCATGAGDGAAAAAVAYAEDCNPADATITPPVPPCATVTPTPPVVVPPPAAPPGTTGGFPEGFIGKIPALHAMYPSEN